MKKFLLAASVASLAMSAASAETVNFSSLALGAMASPVQIGDWLLTPISNSPPQVEEINGQKVLISYDYWTGDDTIVTRVDGRAFTLNSVVIGSANRYEGTLQGIAGGHTPFGDINGDQFGFGLSGVATPDSSPMTIELGDMFTNVKWVDLDSLRQAYFVSFDATVEAAVPEPASWAMMLGGFGLVGGALRSRRKAAVSFG